MQIHSLTEEGSTKSKAKLEALRNADKIRRETSHAKNDLESYILKVCPRSRAVFAPAYARIFYFQSELVRSSWFVFERLCAVHEGNP